MKWFSVCFFGFFVFLLLLDYSIAVRCYICNSYFRSTCGDWFDNSTYKTEQCDDGVTMCRKIVQEVYYDDHWDVRYLRQCAPTGIVGKFDGRECLVRTGTYRVKMTYCHCDNRNGCNTASDVTVSKVMMVLSTFSALWTVLVNM